MILTWVIQPHYSCSHSSRTLSNKSHRINSHIYLCAMLYGLDQNLQAIFLPSSIIWALDEHDIEISHILWKLEKFSSSTSVHIEFLFTSHNPAAFPYFTLTSTAFYLHFHAFSLSYLQSHIFTLPSTFFHLHFSIYALSSTLSHLHFFPSTFLRPHPSI